MDTLKHRVQKNCSSLFPPLAKASASEFWRRLILISAQRYSPGAWMEGIFTNSLIGIIHARQEYDIFASKVMIAN